MTEEALDEILQEIADLKKRVSDLEYLNSVFYEDDLK